MLILTLFFKKRYVIFPNSRQFQNTSIKPLTCSWVTPTDVWGRRPLGTALPGEGEKASAPARSPHTASGLHSASGAPAQPFSSQLSPPPSARQPSPTRPRPPPASRGARGGDAGAVTRRPSAEEPRALHVPSAEEPRARRVPQLRRPRWPGRARRV